MPDPARRSIFAVHPGSLGDVLLSLPALRALRSMFPGHELALVARRELGKFLHDCGEVDKTFAIEDQAVAGLWAGAPCHEADLLDGLVRCEMAVCWLEDPDRRLQENLTQQGVRRAIIRSPHGSGYEAVHQSDRFLETLPGGPSFDGQGNTLHLPDQVVDAGRRYLEGKGVRLTKPLVILHPGSGSPHKCCRPELFGDIIEWLIKRDHTPVVVCGPSDKELVERAAKAGPYSPLVLDELDLRLVAGVLACAALFIGHDSGLTHVAACLGLPTIALFGPTSVHRWGPRGPRVTIRSGKACECEGWTAVRACADKPCLNVPFQCLSDACELVLNTRSRPHPSTGHGTSSCYAL